MRALATALTHRQRQVDGDDGAGPIPTGFFVQDDLARTRKSGGCGPRVVAQRDGRCVSSVAVTPWPMVSSESRRIAPLPLPQVAHHCGDGGGVLRRITLSERQGQVAVELHSEPVDVLQHGHAIAAIPEGSSTLRPRPCTPTASAVCQCIQRLQERSDAVLAMGASPRLATGLVFRHMLRVDCSSVSRRLADLADVLARAGEPVARRTVTGT